MIRQSRSRPRTGRLRATGLCAARRPYHSLHPQGVGSLRGEDSGSARTLAGSRRARAAVGAVASAHIGRLRDKITGMQSIVATPDELAAKCTDHDRPDCPTLRDLARSSQRDCQRGLGKSGSPVRCGPTAPGGHTGEREPATRHGGNRNRQAVLPFSPRAYFRAATRWR